MKKCILEFIRRGMFACGIGPLVLAVVYMVLYSQGSVEVLTVKEVCLGIVSLTALAFIAGGMNVVYQIERLPLTAAIALHGGVLYVGYLVTYLLNGWLQQGRGPLLIFSGVFAAGYLLIWALIYGITKRRTQRINQLLENDRRNESAS